MRYVIKNEGDIGLAIRGVPDPYIGFFLKIYDPDAESGRGRIVWTARKEDAMQFEDRFIALQLWKVQSTVDPIRDDGRPNRPLTAFTISIEPLEDA